MICTPGCLPPVGRGCYLYVTSQWEAKVNTYTIAYNHKTSIYDIHRAGCRHLIAATNDVVCYENSINAAELAAKFERENDDCLTKLAPCAK